MQHAYDLGFSYMQSIDVRISDIIKSNGTAHLLLLPERQETDTGDLNDLEADTGNITLSLTPATEAGDQNLVVLVDKVQATVVGDCGWSAGLGWGGLGCRGTRETYRKQ